MAEMGLIEGIMDFLRILEEMEKEGQTEKTDEGEFESGGFTGSYACRIRIGLRPSDYGINTDGKNKFELLDKGNFFLLKAYLPKLKNKKLNFEISGKKLKIIARTEGGEMKTELELTKASKTDKVLDAKFKDGFLEIKLRKKR